MDKPSKGYWRNWGIAVKVLDNMEGRELKKDLRWSSGKTGEKRR